MKPPVFVLGLLLALSVSGKDPRVVYIEADPATNQQAIDLLTKRFDAMNDFTRAGELFGSVLLCPPALWEQNKSHPAVNGLTNGVMKGRVPYVQNGKVVKMVPRDGKLFQTRKDVAAFWSAFSDSIGVTGRPVIRKLNEQERDVVWTMIPFKIIEPAFIMEWPQHAILVFMTGDFKIAYIDELQRYIDGSFWKTAP